MTKRLVRQSERTSSNTPAVIGTEDDSFRAACIVCNLSEGGAKLMIEEPTPTPAEFVLFLRPDSPIGRRCHVIWRIENKIGVRFVSAFDSDKSSQKGSGVWAPG
jgi:hypothetical protein